MSKPTEDTLVHSLKKWGENSFNPVILATLIAPQHLKPLQPVGGIVFPAALLVSSYVSINGYKKDGAGLIGSVSGLYALLSLRRRHRIAQKFSPRGILRGITLGVCALNVVSCGLAYTFGDRAKEAEERGE